MDGCNSGEAERPPANEQIPRTLWKPGVRCRIHNIFLPVPLSMHFMEPGCSLTHLQQLSTCPFLDTLYGTREFVAAFTKAFFLSHSRYRPIESTSSHCVLLGSILILSQVDSLNQVSLPKSCMHFCFSPRIYHSPIFGNNFNKPNFYSGRN